LYDFRESRLLYLSRDYAVEVWTVSPHPTSESPFQQGAERKRTTELQKIAEKEKINPSSHKIWGHHRTGHNAHYLGNLLRGLSASAIFNETSLSSTELPTEAVEQNLCQVPGRDRRDGQDGFIWLNWFTLSIWLI
jgi:hypothetical protein